MFNISEETKQKILEAIFVIEDDDNRKDRYKEVTVKSGVNNVFKKVKFLFRFNTTSDLIKTIKLLNLVKKL
ncbi:hypothetical protein IDG46_04865 [Staphylococcus sp. EG-SA-13]|nr:hypothetical protein [Staphylococcus sp. EG-SA-13]